MKHKRFSLGTFTIAHLLFIAACNGDGANQSAAKTDPVDDHSSKNELFKKYKLENIQLPAGFEIDVYAEIPGARSMTLSPEGTLYVGTTKSKVFAVTDTDRDGSADQVSTIADGLNAPNGVAFKDGNLFIGATDIIYRIDSIESKLENPSKPVKVYDNYPTERHHGNRYMAFGPDGKLYVAIGAPCNTCESENPVFASITRINADGTGMEIFASGVRNTVGFDWHPQTKELWFTENGRDNMGDDQPEDEVNVAPKAGLHFGYPYCHGGNILDDEFGKGKNCADYTAPVKLVGPHVAALGMRFNTSDQFPADYSNAIFIAQHGSWNRTTPLGYRIMVVKTGEDGKVKDPEIFAEGWLKNVRDVSGRPVDIQFLPDGSLLVSDDYAGAIYRISYRK